MAESCPKCLAPRFHRHGLTKSGRQHRRCAACGYSRLDGERVPRGRLPLSGVEAQILEHLQRNPLVTAKDLAEALNYSRKNLDNYLRRMRQDLKVFAVPHTVWHCENLRRDRERPGLRRRPPVRWVANTRYFLRPGQTDCLRSEWAAHPDSGQGSPHS